MRTRSLGSKGSPAEFAATGKCEQQVSDTSQLFHFKSVVPFDCGGGFSDIKIVKYSCPEVDGDKKSTALVKVYKTN